MFTLHCISIVIRNGKGNYSILTRKSKNFLIELKKSLLITKDKPSLNGNITLAPGFPIVRRGGWGGRRGGCFPYVAQFC